MTVRDFLAEYVETFEELGAVVAVASAGGACPYATALAATRLAEPEGAEVLDRLVARGLLAYSADRREVRAALDDPRLAELAALYREDTVAVLRLMNSLAIDRVRLGATRLFADAFVFRRK